MGLFSRGGPREGGTPQADGFLPSPASVNGTAARRCPLGTVGRNPSGGLTPYQLNAACPCIESLRATGPPGLHLRRRRGKARVLRRGPTAPNAHGKPCDC